MKPAPFDYFAPRGLDEAIDLLDRQADSAKLLAGGQSLMPVLNMRLATPSVLIDLNRLADLVGIEESPDGLVIGALTRQRRVERSPVVARACPLLAAALPYVAHPQIRNRGTIGGNLAHADPSSEVPAVLVALGGAVVATGPAGARSIPAGGFFLGPLTTALAPNEIVTEVRFPVQPPGAGWSFQEFARRHGDYGLAAVAATLSLDADGRISRAGLGLAGVGPTPIRPVAAEAFLIGQVPEDATWREAGRLAAAACDPESDVQAPAAFRRHLVEVLVRRALAEAAGRVRPLA